MLIFVVGFFLFFVFLRSVESEQSPRENQFCKTYKSSDEPNVVNIPIEPLLTLEEIFLRRHHKES